MKRAESRREKPPPEMSPIDAGRRAIARRCGDPSRRPGSSPSASCARRRARDRRGSTRCDACARSSRARGGTAARVCAGPDAGLWALDASAGTLGVGTPEGAPPSATLDLRVPTGLPGEQRRKPPTPFEDLPEASAEEKEKRARRAETADSLRADEESENSSDPSDGSGGSVLETRVAAVFDRVWWSYNSGAKTPLAVWRPRCPPGFASLGDVAVRALEPPASATLARVPMMKESLLGEDDSEVTKKSKRAPVVLPVGFERVWRDDGWRAAGKKRGTASFWRPVPPPGYVACGHAASASHAPPPITAAWCVRSDLAVAIPRDAFVRGDGASSSPWTPAGAAFKLGRAPLAIHAEPRDPAFDPSDGGALFSRRFFAVADERAGAAPPDGTAFRPNLGGVATGRTEAPSKQPPGFGFVVSARFDRVRATAFLDAAAATRPLARLALGGVAADARLGGPAFSAFATGTAEMAHFNRRVAAWEPVLEPWDVEATAAELGASSSSSGNKGVEASNASASRSRTQGDPTPRPGVSCRVVGASPPRRPHARLRRQRRRRARGGGGSRWVRDDSDSDSTPRGGSGRDGSLSAGLVNALGRKVWVRESAGGGRGEVAPGRRPPRRRRGRRTERLRGDGGFDPGVDRRDHGDSSDVPSHRGDEPRGD